MSQFHSPLRYPGGKRKLSNFIKLILKENKLLDGYYVEPYAGGSALALSLLFNEYIRKIYINDIDKSIFTFWDQVLNNTSSICQKIKDTPVTVEEWERQKKIQNSVNPNPLDLAFSTFFLNRTNRSGIISGGIIGGKKQDGRWKLDARFNKIDLIKRIEKIGRFKDRIILSNYDAEIFLEKTLPNLNRPSLIYFDPPYYVKGKEALYTNFYMESDHERVANRIYNLDHSWIISYDNVKPIFNLYNQFRYITYGLNYSAQSRYIGKEIMFFSDNLSIPEVPDPTKINSKTFREIYAV